MMKKTQFTQTALAILVASTLTACGGGSDGNNANKTPTSSVKPSTEKPSTEKPGNEKPGNEKPGNEKPGNEKPGNEKPGNEKPGNEKPGNEKPGNEKPSDEKPSDEKPNTRAPKIGDLVFTGIKKYQTEEVKEKLKKIFKIDPSKSAEWDNQNASYFDNDKKEFNVYYNNLIYSHIASVDRAMPKNKKETGETFDTNQAFLVYSGDKTSKEQMQTKTGSATYLGHAFFLVSAGSGKFAQPVNTGEPMAEAKLEVNFGNKKITGDLIHYSSNDAKKINNEYNVAKLDGTIKSDGSFSGDAKLTKWKDSDRDVDGKFEGSFMGPKAQELAGAAEFSKYYRAVFNASKDADRARYKIVGGYPKLNSSKIDCNPEVVDTCDL